MLTKLKLSLQLIRSVIYNFFRSVSFKLKEIFGNMTHFRLMSLNIRSINNSLKQIIHTPSNVAEQCTYFKPSCACISVDGRHQDLYNFPSAYIYIYIYSAAYVSIMSIALCFRSEVYYYIGPMLAGSVERTRCVKVLELALCSSG